VKKIKRLPIQVSGGALDDRLDPKVLEIIESIQGNQEAMRKGIENRVGWFRMFRDSRQTEPQAQDLMEHLQRIREAARFVGESITSLPLSAGALFHDKIYHMGGDQYLSPRTLEQELVKVEALMGYIAKQIEPRGKGDKSSALEHQLLSDVASIIEEHSDRKIGQVALAGIAAEITSHICLVPTDPKKAREKIIRVRAAKPSE